MAKIHFFRIQYTLFFFHFSLFHHIFNQTESFCPQSDISIRMQILLHLIASQHEIAPEGILPPVDGGIAVGGAAEGFGGGVGGATVIVPRHEEKPFGTSFPLGGDGGNGTAFCQGSHLEGLLFLEELEVELVAVGG